MRTLAQSLAKYAAYHRDWRNRATHYLGIPLIVLAVAVLLSRPQLVLGGALVTPAVLVAACVVVYYFFVDIGMGAIMAGLLGLVLWLGSWVALQGTPTWLAVGLGALVIGWELQFLGHAFEGRKPAFLDDLASLAIGPLFVVTELLFALGCYRRLREEMSALQA